MIFVFLSCLHPPFNSPYPNHRSVSGRLLGIQSLRTVEKERCLTQLHNSFVLHHRQSFRNPHPKKTRDPRGTRKRSRVNCDHSPALKTRPTAAGSVVRSLDHLGVALKTVNCFGFTPVQRALFFSDGRNRTPIPRMFPSDPTIFLQQSMHHVFHDKSVMTSSGRYC